MKCVLVCAGEFCRDKFNADGAAVVAVDGGYRHVRDIAKVDYLIGDLDSLGFEPQDVETVKHSPVKDFTDMGLAVEFMADKGYDEFVVFGGLGGRLDHTIANLQNAYGFCQKGYKISFVDAACKIEFVREKHIIMGRRGQVFSLFAFDNIAGVTVKGAKYPLDNATLRNDFPLGVSNETTGDCCEISVENGILMLIINDN